MVVLLWSPRSEVCVELAETLGSLAAEDSGKWVLASVNVNTAPEWRRSSASRRCPPWWRWAPDSHWPALPARSRASSFANG